MLVKIPPYTKFHRFINRALNKIGIRDMPQPKNKIRIDDSDVWNLHDTLALIIHPALIRLKEIKHGSGFVDDEDVPEGLRSTSAPPKEHEYDADDNFFKRWGYVLDEMIWAFYQYTIDWENQFYSGNADLKFVPSEDMPGYSVMEHGPNHTFKVDEDGKKAHWDRMQNGLRLFAKYYKSLWD